MKSKIKFSIFAIIFVSLFYIILSLQAHAIPSQCTPNWNCTEWNSCIGDIKTRTCNDISIPICNETTVTETQACCVVTWSCTPWSRCIDGKQSQTCTDANGCYDSLNNTIVNNQTCTCQELWNCTEWEECQTDGKQTRICSDLYECGTTTGKPVELQNCVYICKENWQCTEWGTCIGKNQTRSCTDANSCGTTTSKPTEKQSCICTESWSCTNWGACQSNSKQTRTCTDANQCGTANSKPGESQSCTYSSGSSGGSGGGSGGSSTINRNSTDYCINRILDCEPTTVCKNSKQEYKCTDITPIERCPAKKTDTYEIRDCVEENIVNETEQAANETAVTEPDETETNQDNQITGMSIFSRIKSWLCCMPKLQVILAVIAVLLLIALMIASYILLNE